MKQSSKAILFATLIYPGTGHIVLQKPWRAAGFMVIATISFLFVLVHIFTVTQQIVDRVISGEIAPDFLLIRQLVMEQQVQSSTLVVDMAFVILLLTWLLGIVDTYRLTRV